jgi:hypothetical protein
MIDTRASEGASARASATSASARRRSRDAIAASTAVPRASRLRGSRASSVSATWAASRGRCAPLVEARQRGIGRRVHRVLRQHRAQRLEGRRLIALLIQAIGGADRDAGLQRRHLPALLGGEPGIARQFARHGSGLLFHAGTDHRARDGQSGGGRLGAAREGCDARGFLGATDIVQAAEAADDRRRQRTGRVRPRPASARARAVRAPKPLEAPVPTMTCCMARSPKGCW